jgi:hypothetical protein
VTRGRILFAVATVAAVLATAIRYGFEGVVVLAFFGLMAGSFAAAMSIGGDLIRRSSRGHFDRQRR